MRWAIGRAGASYLGLGDGDGNGAPPEASSPPPAALAMRVQWKADLKMCVDASPLLVCVARGGADGECGVRVVVGSHAGLVQSLDLASGAVLWSAQLPDRLEASCAPSADGGAVLVGCYDEHLYALSAADGATLWRHRAGGAVKAAAPSLPLAHGGAALCACFGGRLAALDGTHGGGAPAVLWESALEGAVFASPLVDAARRHVYCGDLRGCLSCFAYDDTPSATLRWRFRTTERSPPHEGCEPIFSAPALAAAAVVFGAMDGRLYAVAADTGAPMWSFDAGGPVFAAPCVAAAAGAAEGAAAEEVVLFTSQAGRLFCASASDGALRWARPAEVHGHSSPATDVARARGAAPRPPHASCASAPSTAACTPSRRRTARRSRRGGCQVRSFRRRCCALRARSSAAGTTISTASSCVGGETRRPLPTASMSGGWRRCDGYSGAAARGFYV